MSNADPVTEKKDAVPPATGTTEAPAADVKMAGAELASKDEQTKEGRVASSDPSQAPPPVEKTAEEAPQVPSDKPTEAADVEMKDSNEAPAAPATTETLSSAKEGTTATTGDNAAAVMADKKPKAPRKSGGVSEAKGKKLNKKGSKARFFNTDAQPGDQFLVKLKGFPPWPAIICDESMLPVRLLTSRPVTARRADGTYREDYADGGKRVNDRTFPVMYLFTNEFGWVPNGSLQELSPEKAAETATDKMRKDLQAAYELAAQGNSLDHYKDVLQKFQDEIVASQAAAAEAQEKKKKKAKAAAEAETAEDVEMADASEEPPAKEKKTKKRKVEDETATPQRSDSVKKPKIKLTTSSTPKTANGVPTPKSAKEHAGAKSTKSKSKSAAKDEEKKPQQETVVPKEPALSAEEQHQRKTKEIMFFRHKLQKGLLTHDHEPKEEEMKGMSDYIAKLEALPDLEVSIIRATKINKVLKAILKMDSIPKEETFNFKSRSQSLLDKWNTMLLSAPAPETSASANGVNGAPAEPSDSKEAKAGPNGVEGGDAAAKSSENATESATRDGPPAEKPDQETSKAPEAVAGSA